MNVCALRTCGHQSCTVSGFTGLLTVTWSHRAIFHTWGYGLTVLAAAAAAAETQSDAFPQTSSITGTVHIFSVNVSPLGPSEFLCWGKVKDPQPQALPCLMECQSGGWNAGNRSFSIGGVRKLPSPVAARGANCSLRIFS